jgi:hypothetical protein
MIRFLADADLNEGIVEARQPGLIPVFSLSDSGAQRRGLKTRSRRLSSPQASL